MAVSYWGGDGKPPKPLDTSNMMPFADFVVLRAPAVALTEKGWREVKRLRKKWADKYPHICGMLPAQ